MCRDINFSFYTHAHRIALHVTQFENRLSKNEHSSISFYSIREIKITKREANEIKLNHAIVEVDILIYLLTKKREKKNSKTTEDWSIKQKHILTF